MRPHRFGIDFITILLIGLTLTVFLFLFSEQADARIITVDDDGEGEFTSIQEAISASEDGDTVRVWEGNYMENIIIDRSISIDGNGSSNTTIDGEEKGNTVTIITSNTSLTGFTLTKSGINNFTIYIESENTTITNNHIEIAQHRCIFVNNSNSTLICNNTIKGNLAVGVYIQQSNFTKIFNNTITSNGAGVIDYGYSTVISNNIIQNNSVYSVTSYGDSVIIENNNISNNACSGIKFNGNSAIIRNNTILKNSGSGVVLLRSDLTTISENSIFNNGGGIRISSSKSSYFFSNTLVNNYIGVSGFSISHWNTHTIPENNTLDGKPIKYLKNIIDQKIHQDSGQVILVNCTNFTIEGHLFNEFKLTSGFSSNMLIKNNNMQNNSHFSISLYSSDFCTIINNSFQNNSEVSIWLASSNHCTISDNLFLNNSIIISGTSNMISQNIFQNNKQIWISGSNKILNNTFSNSYGWIYDDNNEISNNTFSEFGIYVRGNSNILINNTLQNISSTAISLHGDSNIISNNHLQNISSTAIKIRYGFLNIISNNIIMNNSYGIYASFYYDLFSNNTISNNSISGNTVGIYLRERSIEINTHKYINICNNKIFDNRKYGLEYHSNNNHTINATHNWWGDSSGPYHPDRNPGGKGDNVSDLVNFKPWLSMPVEEKEPSYFVIYVLMMMIAALFVILACVVSFYPSTYRTPTLPSNHQQTRRAETSTDQPSDKSPGDFVICSNCGNSVNTKKQDSIRIFCDKCGKNVLNAKFR